MRSRSFILQDGHFYNPLPKTLGSQPAPSLISPVSDQVTGLRAPTALGIQDRLYHQGIEQLREPGAERDSTSLLSGYLCVQTGLLQGDGFLGLTTLVKPEPLQERRVNEDQTHSTYCQVKTTNKHHHKAVAKSKNRVCLESSLFKGRS